MRWFRLAAGVVLVCIVVVTWQRRERVVEAYTDERPPVQIDFDGLDFSLANRPEVGQSPLVVPVAPDTKATSLTPVAVTSPQADPAGLPEGSMRLSGTVRNGGVPVPFATVRLEHHRSNISGGSPTIATAEVLADEFGQWIVEGVAGGRWRIRSFVPELLGSSGSVVQFLAARESTSIDLTVVEPDPRLVVDLVAQPTLLVGQQGAAAVTVGVRRVDAEGLLVIEPVPQATVTLTLGPGAVLRPLSAMSTTTNGAGAATFGFACETTGASMVTAAVNASIAVSVPGGVQEPVGSDPIDGDPGETPARPAPPVVSVEQRVASLSASLPACELPPPPPEETAPATDEGTVIGGDDG